MNEVIKKNHYALLSSQEILMTSSAILVHLGMATTSRKSLDSKDKFISVINQLDAQNFCFTISLFHASTCFEHNVLIIRRSKLHFTASGIIIPVGVMIQEAV